MVFKTVSNDKTVYFDDVRRISVKHTLHGPACDCEACASIRNDKKVENTCTEILEITLLSGVDNETEIRFNAQQTGYLLNAQGKTIDMIRISAK